MPGQLHDSLLASLLVCDYSVSCSGTLGDNLCDFPRRWLCLVSKSILVALFLETKTTLGEMVI